MHSCWRVDKKSEYGVVPYQIHLIIYGHKSALKRIQAIDYHLPGYPKEHKHQFGGPPERLFELKELANGFSIVQAHVHIDNQPKGAPKVLELSRFVNMTESGPRILEPYGREISLH